MVPHPWLVAAVVGLCSVLPVRAQYDDFPLRVVAIVLGAGLGVVSLVAAIVILILSVLLCHAMRGLRKAQGKSNTVPSTGPSVNKDTEIFTRQDPTPVTTGSMQRHSDTRHHFDNLIYARDEQPAAVLIEEKESSPYRESVRRAPVDYTAPLSATTDTQVFTRAGHAPIPGTTAASIKMNPDPRQRDDPISSMGRQSTANHQSKLKAKRKSSPHPQSGRPAPVQYTAPLGASTDPQVFTRQTHSPGTTTARHQSILIGRESSACSLSARPAAAIPLSANTDTQVFTRQASTSSDDDSIVYDLENPIYARGKRPVNVEHQIDECKSSPHPPSASPALSPQRSHLVPKEMANYSLVEPASLEPDYENLPCSASRFTVVEGATGRFSWAGETNLDAASPYSHSVPSEKATFGHHLTYPHSSHHSQTFNATHL